MKNLQTLVLTLFILSLAASCAKTDEQLLDSAKQSAKYYLSSEDCSSAREALTDIGYQGDDPVYVQLLAASYACDAGYADLDLFAELADLPSGAASFVGALTAFDSSNETEAESDNFASLMTGIDTILGEGGSAAGRVSKYGAIKGLDMNIQALYMILVEFGKFMQYYGNAAAGNKGAGTAGNTCLLTYTVQDAMDFIALGGGGACGSGDSGHADLPGPATAATTQARLCHGIYLFNNLRDLLGSIDFGDDASFGSIGDVSAAFEAAIVTAETADPGDRITTVKDIYTKEACANLTLDELEVWYAVVFETLFQ